MFFSPWFPEWGQGTQNKDIKPMSLGRELWQSIRQADMEFVKKFTPPEFRAKNFTPSISPNFNSVSG